MSNLLYLNTNDIQVILDAIDGSVLPIPPGVQVLGDEKFNYNVPSGVIVSTVALPSPSTPTLPAVNPVVLVTLAGPATPGLSLEWGDGANVGKLVNTADTIDNMIASAIAAALNPTSIEAALGFTPVNKAGDTMNGRLQINQGSIGSSFPLEVNQTWNNGAVNFTALKVNVIATANAAGSNLIDLQKAGVSQFKVDYNGNMTLGGNFNSVQGFTAYSTTAPPFAGTGKIGYLIGNSVQGLGIVVGTGAPTLSLDRGSLYLRTDTGIPYYNTNGTTGWEQLVTLTGAQTLTNKTITSPTIATNMGVNVAPASTALITAAGSFGSATAVQGMLMGPVIQSAVTSSYIAYYSAGNTQAAAFTLSSVRHFQTNGLTLGATSSITNQYGFFVESTFNQAINNYGFYGGIASGANNYNLYMAGTANNYLGGRLGIGTVGLTDRTISLALPITGATSSYGIVFGGTIQSDVTASYMAVYSGSGTQAASFTLPTYIHFIAQPPSTFGVGSTVTNQYGFYASSSMTGATNNYGFYSAIASGSNRWNFYAGGTAANFFAGDLTIYGGTAIPAGGTAGTGLKLSSTVDFGMFFGSGAPTLSAAQGSIYLRSDGAPYYNNNGTTGWTQIGAGITAADDHTTASSLYPLFASAATGQITNVYTDNGNLNFKPSTGEFSARVMIANNGIVVNNNTISSDYTIATGQNGMSAGPITIASGITVTISSGSTWTTL